MTNTFCVFYKSQMLIKLRTKIIEHYFTYENFVAALKETGLKIDATVISRIVNENRSPTDLQREIFERLLNTSAKTLFKGDNNVRNNRCGSGHP